MEDRKKQLFDEHLPYELEMFEEAARFLMSDECAKLDRENNKDDWFRANAAVEAFWTHARTLKEFFTQRKNPEPVQDAHHASAQDFAPDYWNDLELNAVIDKINAQVSHLTENLVTRCNSLRRRSTSRCADFRRSLPPRLQRKAIRTKCGIWRHVAPSSSFRSPTTCAAQPRGLAQALPRSYRGDRGERGRNGSAARSTPVSWSSVRRSGPARW